MLREGKIVFQKRNKQKLQNYSPKLPISSKIRKMLLYKSMFRLFTENSVTLCDRLDLTSADSCTNQLLPISHEI